MKYIVQKPDGSNCYLEMIGQVIPELPVGFTLLGKAEDLTEEAAAIDAAFATEAAQNELKKVVSDAVNFGSRMIQDFTVENITLGITQANMTGPVRKKMAEVLSALQTGSLYDAIAEARAIPAEDKDATFITDARLLAFINKIEAYLGIALSEVL